MDVQRIACLLPEHPRQGMLEYVKENCNGELGPEMAIFNRESIRLFEDYYADMRMIMTPEQVEEAESKIKSVWGANVKCTFCGDEYTAGYVSCPDKEHSNGIRLIQGDDGLIYTGYTDGNFPTEEVVYAEGENFVCPICGEKVELVRKSKLRHGRTYQVQVCSVEIIEQYTVLMFWLVSRHVNDYGYCKTEVKPREALVIDEKGRLKRFAHYWKYFESEIRSDYWEKRSSFQDSFQSTYYDWPSMMHRKIGGMCWTDIPDLLGTTGEKTGITEYIRAGGNWPAVYLKQWQKYPCIENLVKAGWAKAVISEINNKVITNREYRWKTLKAFEFRWGNWDQVKPSRILGMTKEETRSGSEWHWNHDMMFEWWGYRNTDNHSSATVFNDFYRKVGLESVQKVCGLLENSNKGYELPKLMKYFEKFPDLKPSDALQYLIDVRTIAAELSLNGEVPPEHMWPKNLIAVHDRLDRMQRSMKTDADRKKYAEGFKANVEKYKGLDWNDGKLCIRIARTNGDLIDEGNVLDHCVGGYGENHIKGEDVIFFVRKYRRPERNYYTLDINFTKDEPFEKQLHGYGNEKHGPNKKHSHSIPKKVRAFVDRWKEEVLKPWFLAKAIEQVGKPKQKSGRAGELHPSARRTSTSLGEEG